MSILRKHKSANYTVIANEALADEGLSFKAKGLLVYLLSKPDDWSVSYRQLMKVGPDGESAVKSGLTELEDAGYLHREKIQGSDGRWTSISHLFERPTEKGFSSPGFSSQGKPPHITSTEELSTENQLSLTPSEDQGGSQDSVVRLFKRSVDEEFDRWWELVPKKANKGGARKAYRAARQKTDPATLFTAMGVYAKSVEDSESRFIKHPATWLNGECWDDEIEDPDDGWNFGSGVIPT